jgi:hypothetical protein
LLDDGTLRHAIVTLSAGDHRHALALLWREIRPMHRNTLTGDFERVNSRLVIDYDAIALAQGNDAADYGPTVTQLPARYYDPDRGLRPVKRPEWPHNPAVSADPLTVFARLIEASEHVAHVRRATERARPGKRPAADIAPGPVAPGLRSRFNARV